MTKFLSKLLFAFVLAIIFSPIISYGQSSLYQNQRIYQGDSLIFQLNGFFAGNVITPKNGTLTRVPISGGSIFKYKPNASFEGRDTILINMFNSLSTYIGYIVSTSNSYVDSKNDYRFSTMNSNLDIDALANDSSTTGSKTLTKVSVSNGGTASINNNLIHFEPFDNFTGIARIYYTVCNEVGVCNESQVFVYVSSSIDSDTNQIYLNKNKSSIIILPDNNFVLTSSPNKGGQLTFIENNAYNYKPAVNFSGIEKFTFTNSNGKLFHVSSKIFNTNNPTFFVKDDIAYTPEATPITINVQSNDIEKSKFVINSFTNSNDALSITQNGALFTVVPKNNFKGTIHFTYNAKYIGSPSNNVPANETGNVAIVVSNQKPIQQVYSINSIKNTPTILKNKSNLNAYNINIIDNPYHGTVNYYPGYNSIVLNGENVSGYNMLIYTPNNNYIGPDSLLIEHCINGNCSNVLINTNVIDKNTTCFNDCVWPGDANKDGIVDFTDALVLGSQMGKVGEERVDPENDYYPQAASNWNNPFSENIINNKHLDANGDGIISIEDTVAINNFYLQTNNITNENFSIFKQSPLDIIDANPGFHHKGDKVKLYIVLGIDTTPAINFNGINFSLTFSPTKVNPDSTRVKFYSDSWLTYTSSYFDMIKKPIVGRTDMIISRVGNKPTSGIGIIGEINIVVEVDVNGFQLSDDAFNYHITNIRVAGNDGEIYALPDITKRIKILKEKAPLDNSQLLLSPNPTNGVVELYMNGGYVINGISVHNTSGQLVENITNLNTKNYKLDLSNLASGLYFVSVQTPDGIVNKKVEVIK